MKREGLREGWGTGKVEVEIGARVGSVYYDLVVDRLPSKKLVVWRCSDDLLQRVNVMSEENIFSWDPQANSDQANSEMNSLDQSWDYSIELACFQDLLKGIYKGGMHESK